MNKQYPKKEVQNKQAELKINQASAVNSVETDEQAMNGMYGMLETNIENSESESNSQK